MMFSLLHRLHLTGKSFIIVVGSNHKTVCLPQEGQRYRWRFVFASVVLGLNWMVFCNNYHLDFLLVCSNRAIKKACTIIAYID